MQNKIVLHSKAVSGPWVCGYHLENGAKYSGKVVRKNGKNYKRKNIKLPSLPVLTASTEKPIRYKRTHTLHCSLSLSFANGDYKHISD